MNLSYPLPRHVIDKLVSDAKEFQAAGFRVFMNTITEKHFGSPVKGGPVYDQIQRSLIDAGVELQIRRTRGKKLRQVPGTRFPIDHFEAIRDEIIRLSDAGQKVSMTKLYKQFHGSHPTSGTRRIIMQRLSQEGVDYVRSRSTRDQSRNAEAKTVAKKDRDLTHELDEFLASETRKGNERAFRLLKSEISRK